MEQELTFWGLGLLLMFSLYESLKGSVGLLGTRSATFWIVAACKAGSKKVTCNPKP